MPTPPINVKVECPNCGARNANVKTSWQDPVTKKPINKDGGMDSLHAAAVIIVSGALSFAVVNAFFGASQDCLALILTALLSLGVFTVYSYRVTKQQMNAVHIYNYECQYCRHRWSWQEGTIVPKFSRKQEIWQEYETLFGSDAVNKEMEREE